MKELSCKDLVKEVARMYPSHVPCLSVCLSVCEVSLNPAPSVHTVHDEVKDKSFELELSWVGEGTYIHPALKLYNIYIHCGL